MLPLQPGDSMPDVVLDAITRDGKVALADYRGRSALLIGIFRGLHCPFCRRHIAAMAELQDSLEGQGVETLAVVNTPIERARLYFRHRPLPRLLAAADPERVSHRAFGLPKLEFTQGDTAWPNKIAMDAVMQMRINPTGELPAPVNPFEAFETLNRKDGYEITPADQQIMATGAGQLVGQFLLDRAGTVRWAATEVPEGGQLMFQGPKAADVMSAVAGLAGR
jgi:peroxiredoxin